MKNKLTDLNNHLFSQLDRLNDESLKDKELHAEVARSQAVASIAKQIICNATLALKAEKMRHEGEIKNAPEMLNEPQKPKLVAGPRGV